MKLTSAVLLVGASLLIGCGPKGVTPDLLLEAPRLPSPTSARYVRSQGQPSDAVITELAKAHRWDESLSGAAASLALNWAELGTVPTTWRAREASWQAGYAYPVSTLRGWGSPIGSEPPPELLEWLAALKPEVDLGLVRARGTDGDFWVGLAATPAHDLGSLPRQIQVGGRIDLPVVAGAEATISAPDGRLFRASLEIPQPIEADQRGEWLVEVRQADRRIALFPIYAGMMPPEEVLIEPMGRPESAQRAEEQVRQAWQNARGAYGREPLEDDTMLTAAARSAITEGAANSAQVSQTLSYREDRIWFIECRAKTIEACMDQIVWNPAARPALLQIAGHQGLAVTLSDTEIHVFGWVADPR